MADQNAAVSSLDSLQAAMNKYLDAAQSVESADMSSVLSAAALFQSQLHETSRSAHERGVYIEERRRAGDPGYI